MALSEFRTQYSCGAVLELHQASLDRKFLKLDFYYSRNLFFLKTKLTKSESLSKLFNFVKRNQTPFQFSIINLYIKVILKGRKIYLNPQIDQ